MKVRVDNSYCEASQSLDASTIQANKETGIIFQCNNIKGSIITVENKNWLQIAEIEAFRYTTNSRALKEDYDYSVDFKNQKHEERIFFAEKEYVESNALNISTTATPVSQVVNPMPKDDKNMKMQRKF